MNTFYTYIKCYGTEHFYIFKTKIYPETEQLKTLMHVFIEIVTAPNILKNSEKKLLTRNSPALGLMYTKSNDNM